MILGALFTAIVVVDLIAFACADPCKRFQSAWHLLPGSGFYALWRYGRGK